MIERKALTTLLNNLSKARDLAQEAGDELDLGPDMVQYAALIQNIKSSCKDATNRLNAARQWVELLQDDVITDGRLK